MYCHTEITPEAAAEQGVADDLACTLPDNHAGDHQATDGIGGKILAEWADADTTRARYLDRPNQYGGMTDHQPVIDALRVAAQDAANVTERLGLDLAASLLEGHDETGHSLDTWTEASALVNHYLAALAIGPNASGERYLPSNV